MTAGSAPACCTRWMSEASNENAPPASDDARGRRRAEHEPVLADAARDDGHRAGGDVVVVEAGVLLVHPADQPGGDVVVAQQLRVAARRAVVLDEVRPQLRAGSRGPDEVDSARRGSCRHRHRAEDAVGVADGQRVLDGVAERGGPGAATTGRSEP